MKTPSRLEAPVHDVLVVYEIVGGESWPRLEDDDVDSLGAELVGQRAAAGARADNDDDVVIAGFERHRGDIVVEGCIGAHRF